MRTPGRWKATRVPTGQTLMGCPTEYWMVCAPDDPEGRCPAQRCSSEGDARLIAVAPELVTVCKAALANLCGRCAQDHPCGPDQTCDHHVGHQIRKVLKEVDR